MSQGRALRYREVDETDLPFLAEMAQLFRHGPESAAVRPWGEPEDFGLIAEEASASVAAGWYRRHHAWGGHVSASGFREVFIGVRPEAQGRGIGSELWRRLLLRARSDDDVDALIGMVTPDSSEWSTPRLLLEGFELRQGQHVGTWLLLIDRPGVEWAR